MLWAASGSAAKFLFQNGISPFELVQLRTTIAASVLVAWGLLGRRPLLRPLLGSGGHDRIYFLALGAALAVAQFTYLFAISRIQVAAAILLQYQAPVLIALYSVLFTRAKITVITAGALIGAVLGCALMAGVWNFDLVGMNRAGIMSGLASAAAFALYSLRSEYGMRTYAPWPVVTSALLVAAVIWNIAYPPFSAFSAIAAGIHRHDGMVWIAVVFVGIFGTVLPFGLYNEGIKRIHATHASITATLEPVMAGIIAYFLLGERMEGVPAAGALIVIASIVLLQLGQQRA